MLKAYCGGVSAPARNVIKDKTRRQTSRMKEVWREFISQSGLMRPRFPRNPPPVNVRLDAHPPGLFQATSSGRANIAPVNFGDQFSDLLSCPSSVTRIFERDDDASMKCTTPCSSLMHRPVWAMSMPSAEVHTPTISPVRKNGSTAA